MTILIIVLDWICCKIVVKDDTRWFDDIQHQTVFQNGHWPRFGSCPYMVLRQFGHYISSKFDWICCKIVVYDNTRWFDDIQHQTVFQNGRCPRFGSCPYTVLRQFGHYISSKFDWICCKIVVSDDARWFWWYSTSNSLSKWPLAMFR